MVNVAQRMMPHRYNNRFYNYPGEKPEQHLLTSFCMFLKAFCTRRPHDKPLIPHWVEKPVVIERSLAPRITWLGHSTFLIQIANVNIVTDPVFGDLSFLFKRVLPCAINPSVLPAIDCILISHNHPDHMDKKSLYALKKHQPLVLVPQGDRAWFTKHKFSQVQEFMWWDARAINSLAGSVVCTFLPARHWSQRGIFDRNRSLWGSWMIQAGNYTIYFAGDTAYSSHFSHIKQYFPVINTALLPIGPCEPRAWMKSSHVSAEEAGQAFLDLEATTFIPMHWGTYYFGTDTLLSSLERLMDWWKTHSSQLTAQELQILKIGTSIVQTVSPSYAITTEELIY